MDIVTVMNNLIVAFGIISILIAILAVVFAFSYRKTAMLAISALKTEMGKMKDEHNREIMQLKGDNLHFKNQYEILHSNYLDVLEKLAKK